MNINEAINKFIDDVAGWKSNETPKAYRSKLRRLIDFFPGRTLASIGTSDLNNLKRDLLGRCSPYTVKSVLTTVRYFFKWANDRGLIKHDPADKFKIPAPPPPDPKPISKETVSKLITAAECHGEPWEIARNVALIYWMRDTGGRCCGVVNAMLSGLDLKRGRCNVFEKGKPVTLYLNTPAQAALKQWLKLRPQLEPITDHVFISHKTRAGLKREGIRHIIITLAEVAGVSDRCNPHSFRHAFARDCLQEGRANLAQVSQLLNHKTIAITAEYYARWDDHELKDVHRRASPGARLKIPNDA